MITIYIVQESIFGDYGNGEVYGAFTSKTKAEALADSKGRGHTDVIETTLDVSGQVIAR